MNILQALDDVAVFRPLLRDPETWAAWRSFLASLFALPMTAEQLSTYQACTGRSDPPTCAATEAWLCIGRRGGKSFTLALIACFLACFRDWRPYLGPGERGTVMIVAADRRQARTIMRYVRGILAAVPMLARTIETERNESIDLNNRITLEVHTASFRTVRGYTIVAALLDEIAFWPTDENAADPDREVVSAIRPAMSTVPGSILLAASSPYARKGSLWTTYRRHYGKEGDPVLVWQAATRVMNPTVSQAVVDTEMEKDPSAASAEFLAEFRTDIESFVDRDAVLACVDHGCHERPCRDGQFYIGFCDPSGGSGGDSMTLSIGHKDNDVSVIDVIREVKPPFSPESVVGEFADMLKRYRLTAVTGDRYAGSWPADAFRRQGIQYLPCGDPKGTLYLNLLPRINSGTVRLLDHKRLISQLTSLERRTSRGGKDSIDHPPGLHDDVANAVAGASLATAAIWTRTLYANTAHIPAHMLPRERTEGLRIRTVRVAEADAPAVRWDAPVIAPWKRDKAS